MTEEKGQYAIDMPEAEAKPVNIDARSNSVLNMGADKVRPILQRQVDSGEITEAQFEMVWWLFAFCKENGHSLPDISKQLNYDSTTTLYRVFSGSYGAKLDNVVKEIARFRKMAEERGRVSDVPFVETSIARKVRDVCNAAWVSQSVAMIWGEPQTGKTLALEEFARANNHGATKYIRLPASAGIQLVARIIARACYVSPDSCFEHLRDRIIKSISANNLLIIDEAHEAFLCYQKGSAIKVFEFLREIYDRTHCGMVLCGTNVLRDEIAQGKLSLMLRQLDRRGIIKVQLPDTIPMRDCERIAKEWLRLPPPEGEAKEIVRDLVSKTGCNAYVHFLKAAARLAAGEKVAVNWGHFTKAYAIIRNLSEGK